MRKTANTPLPVPEAPASTLDLKTIHRAAFNAPVGSFTLGDREFPLKDLSYDSYMAFIGYLTPLIEVVVQKIAGKQGVTIPGIDLPRSMFSSTNILSACGKELPEMVQLMCLESDPDITIAEIKSLAKRPTVLASAVIRQIHQNRMIQEFSDFFTQALSMVKPLTADQNAAA